MAAGIGVSARPYQPICCNVPDFKSRVWIRFLEKFKLFIGADMKLLHYCTVHHQPIHESRIVLYVWTTRHRVWIVIMRPISVYHLLERNEAAHFGNTSENKFSPV